MPGWRNWYTRTTQNRVSQELRVRVPPQAQTTTLSYRECCCLGSYTTQVQGYFYQKTVKKVVASHAHTLIK